MNKRQTVHIIDDDPIILFSLEILLESEGFAVETHSSPVEFFCEIEACEVACLITDVDMPKMSGMEVISELSKRGIACPVIVMTGHSDAKIAAEAISLGASEYFEKPFDTNALIAGVRRAVRVARLRRLAPAPAASIKGGTVSSNTFSE